MIDCMKTTNYFAERRRMAKQQKDGICKLDCIDCPLSITNNGAKYILKGCIIRRGITGKFYYQAEIKDLNANSALLYCRLEDLEEMK